MPIASAIPGKVNLPSPDNLVRIAQGMEMSGMAIGLFAPDDSLQFASDGFVELYDIQPGRQTFASLMRHCWESRVGPNIETDDVAVWLAHANQKRRSEVSRQFEIDMVNGRWMWASETTFDQGWLLVTITDFTDVKTRQFALQNDRDAAIIASETDYLTGMYNRGAVMKRLAAQIEQSKAGGSTFSLALIDLDHFKRINDQFGHDSGDQVLTHFAGCAQSVLRERDMLGRVGGEEFMFVMPGTTGARAHGVIERLQAYIKDQRLKVGEVTLRYTFSAGIAEWAPGCTLETLYRDADQALYQAKDQGRNLVRQAS